MSGQTLTPDVRRADTRGAALCFYLALRFGDRAKVLTYDSPQEAEFSDGIARSTGRQTATHTGHATVEEAVATVLELWGCEVVKVADGEPLPLKALSIRQPWAWLIANGWKDVENRPRRLHYRGRLLLHTGLTFDFEGYHWVLDNARALGAPLGRDLTAALPLPTDFPLGGFVGAARMDGCVDESDSVWFTGPHGLLMRDAIELPFRPALGMLGLFPASYAPAEVTA